MHAGKIVAVGDVSAHRAREIHLGEDDYVLPGMFDLHAHYAVDLFGRGRVDETVAYPVLFLANGVTSTFPAGEMDPKVMRTLRLEIDRGDRSGPRIFNSGPYFGTARPGWPVDAPREWIRDEVDHWAAMGAKGFKAKGISAAHLQVLIEQAHQHGLTVTGHLGSGFRNTVNPKDAISMGIDRVEHFLGGDALPPTRSAYASLVVVDTASPAFRDIVRTYLASGVYFDATITAYGYFGAQDPVVFEDFAAEARFLTPFTREQLSRRAPREVNEPFEAIYRVKQATVRAFYDAGGGHLITLGTDHPSWGQFFSGFGVHRELHALVRAGIPPAAALKIATINGARALGVSDRLGSIETGKWADLVVVRGSPFDDIRNTRRVQLVMKGGKVYEAAALLESVEGTIGPATEAQVERWVQR